MKIYKENYGEDMDGNRGLLRTIVELDGSNWEKWEIAKQVLDDILNGEDIDLQKIKFSLVNIENRGRSRREEEHFFEEPIYDYIPEIFDEILERADNVIKDEQKVALINFLRKILNKAIVIPPELEAKICY